MTRSNRSPLGALALCGFVATAMIGCADSIAFRITAPRGATINIEDTSRCRVPCNLQLKTGRYRVTASYGGDALYGYLIVGEPTENAKMTRVQLKIDATLARSAIRDGKVIEAYTYDEGAGGKTLVRIKLGNKRPW